MYFQMTLSEFNIKTLRFNGNICFKVSYSVEPRERITHIRDRISMRPNCLRDPHK